MRGVRFFGWTLCLGALAIGSAVLALTDGAPSDYSGGPASFGTNCAECHSYGGGVGGVELSGAPRRYRPGAVYQLRVRVYDADQAAGGFEISAETTASPAHQGLFGITDGERTKTVGSGSYVTHTAFAIDEHVCLGGASDGLACDPENGDDDCLPDGACLNRWDVNGESYEYEFSWEAPSFDVGPITFFVAGNAVNLGNGPGLDHQYAAYVRSLWAEAGDTDGDADIDLRDFARVQRCLYATVALGDDDCEYADLDGDNTVTLDDVDAFVSILQGPVAAAPAPYLMADAVRGGRLYDKWWIVNGAPEPSGDHPLYPLGGPKAGTSHTYRCKECHGWDYKGAAGVYGQDPEHVTGIAGVWGAARSPQQMFDLLKYDANAVASGHDMAAYGLSDRDLWDVVKMIAESTVDTDTYIGCWAHVDENENEACSIDLPAQELCEANGCVWEEKRFAATFFAALLGGNRYGDSCATCHANVDWIDVGAVAADNPWEFLHKARFGQPGVPMQGLDLIGVSVSEAAHVGAYAAIYVTP